MVDSRKVSVGVDADVNPFVRGMATASAAARTFAGNLDSADSRMSNLVQTSLALGPALVPIAATATPALAGLASQLGFAATAAGVSVLAFQGVGDALKEVNEYAIEPTQENFESMREALDKLGPAGQDFVMFLQSIRPELQGLQDIAQEGLLPGAQEGIEELMELMPQVEGIIREVSSAVGDLIAEAGDNLNDPRWRDFFEYLETEARPQLEHLGRTFGNVFEGLANMWMAFDPLSDNFSSSLLQMSRDFRDWSDTLAESDGFREFVNYIEENGPRVWEALGATANAIIELVEAAAPVGSVALPIIEALADLLAIIADSPAGPTLVATAAGLSAVSRAVALYNAANGSALAGFLGKAGKDGEKAGLGLRGAAAGAGILAVALTDLDDSLGVSNTAMGAMMGMVAGPYGAALGAGIGATLDLAAANDSLTEAIERANEAAAGTDVDAMARAISDVLREAEGFDGFDDIFGLEADKVDSAVARLEQRMRDLEYGTGGIAEVLGSALAPSLGLTADSFELAAMSADDFRASLENVNATLEKRASLRDYQEALDEFRKTLKENGDTLDINTRKGRDNQAALDAIATTALKAAEGLKPMQRIEFLQGARKDLINAAEGLGKTSKGARKLADDLGLVNLKAKELGKQKPTVEVREKGADKTKRAIEAAEKVAMTFDDIESWATVFAEDKSTPKVKEAARELAWFDSQGADAVLTAIDQASPVINDVIRGLGAIPPSVSTVVKVTRQMGGLPVAAEGGTIEGQRHPYGDKVLYLLAPGEEVVSNRFGQADRHRDLLKAINAGRMAEGGTVPGLAAGGTADFSLDDRLNLLNLEQQIRQLQRDLAKTGEDALKGLEITVAQTELEIARRDMRQARRAPFIEARQGLRDQIGGLRDARGGFDVDADMSTRDVREELREFRKAIKEAGGEWTKRLGNMGDRLLKNAQALNKAERAVERETEKRERLQDSLDDQMRSMEDLRRTMDGFASNVAGNFLTNPFGAGYTIPGSPVGAGPVAPDPALIAARDQLGAAESRLAGIRGRTDIDPLTRSYMASKAVAEVAELRSQVEQLDRGAEAIGSLVEPAEKVVSALEAFDEIVRQDIENATKFGGFLDTLASKGLDTKGPLGGLYSELAQSGDLALAGELAGLSPEQIAEYEQLFADRGEAVATVAARATQAVYAEQWAAEQKELRAIQGEMKANARAIERQSNIIERRAERMEAIEERQTEVIASQIGGLRDRIGQLERERETNRQKSGGGKRRR